MKFFKYLYESLYKTSYPTHFNWRYLTFESFQETVYPVLCLIAKLGILSFTTANVYICGLHVYQMLGYSEDMVLYELTLGLFYMTITLMEILTFVQSWRVS